MLKKIIKYLFFIFYILFVIRCNDTNKKIQKSENDFIYIDGKYFKYKNDKFFPLMLNYSVCLRQVNEEYVMAPIKDYEDKNVYEGNSKDSIQNVLKGHFQLLKELGFNSIRFHGISNVSRNDTTGDYLVRVNKKGGNSRLNITDNPDIYLSAIGELVSIAEEKGLKVMILFKADIDDPKRRDFVISMLKYFKKNNTIFAYDLFNEPLYFDNKKLPNWKKHRKKEDAYKITLTWKRMMNKYAPNHLFTIGFAEPIEVFEWDPEILPVDFVAFHTYHPLRVPNEIYWFSKYINKPWMIGETSLPADNDSIMYSEQAQFMKEVYSRIVNCGGAGLGWWGFQDVSWGGFEHDFTSIANHRGVTFSKDKKYKIKGSFKPAAYEVNRLKDIKPTGDCPCMTNYYNMLGYENIVLIGKIINGKTNEPIEGAVIRGWNKWWGIAANTYTNADGLYTLYSNTEFVHFEISAPGMSKITFNYNATYEPTYKHNYTLENLPNKNLEYHKISYSQFLNKDTKEKDYNFKIFNFDKDKFHKAKFKGNIGIKKLYPILLK